MSYALPSLVWVWLGCRLSLFLLWFLSCTKSVWMVYMSMLRHVDQILKTSTTFIGRNKVFTANSVGFTVFSILNSMAKPEITWSINWEKAALGWDTRMCSTTSWLKRLNHSIFGVWDGWTSERPTVYTSSYWWTSKTSNNWTETCIFEEHTILIDT